jgi:hypothetical protein
LYVVSKAYEKLDQVTWLKNGSVLKVKAGSRKAMTSIQ